MSYHVGRTWYRPGGGEGDMRVDDYNNRSPRQRLTVLRIIWAALLFAPIAFFFVVLTIGKNRTPIDPHFAQTLFYINVAMAAVLIPGAFIVRGIMYSRGR